MILNNKVSQTLEIIGFKMSVKKSTSRIQVIHNYDVKSFYINDPIWLQTGRKTIKIMKKDTYNGNVLRWSISNAK